ncbi:MAG: tRNA pseudouridine(55) synthase TruB [Tepidisphaeraceae bacterium]|jgi:tRNA pseudouridine55 synthase
MNGIIVLDKPGSISSAGAVNRVKRLLERGVKIGHAGTLDPFATGVLLLLIGKATKSSQMLMNQPKRYEATIKLGATTATDDPDSPEIPVPGASQPSLENVEAAAAKFVGTISQRPPAFSALKISGRRAYKLARSGQPVDLKARDIRIDAIEIVSWQWPLLRMRIDCGRGTYVRAIARDLGEALKTGGYLTELRRTRIGPFGIDRAVTLERLEKDGIGPHLCPVSFADAENAQQGRQDDQHQR